MATQTTNYGFEKPAATDKLSVLVNYNGNLDLIDSSIKTVSDAATTASSTATAAQSTATAAQSAADAAQSTATAAGTAAAAAASAATAAQSTADSKAAIDDTAAAATTTYSSNKIETELDTKQDTITGAATTIVDSNLTTNRALISNSTGKVEASSITSTQLGYLSGVTSNIQSQINSKLNKSWNLLTNTTPSTSGATVTVSSLSQYTDIVIELEHGTYTADCVFIPDSLFISGNTVVISDWDGTTRNLFNVAYVDNTHISIRCTYNWSGYTVRVYAR